MSLETATYISQLVASNPAHSDPLSAADAHMRLIKGVLQSTLPGVSQALTTNAGAIASVDGTSSAPGLGFLADATAGFYRVGTGETCIVGRLVGQGAVQIGQVIMFAGPTLPTGYMACDGTALSSTTYPELFAVTGYTWGGSSGTFNLPDFRSRFLRHRDTSGPLSLSGALATLQGPANLLHYHNVSGTTATENAAHNHNFSGNTGYMSANQDHSHGTTLPYPGGGAAYPSALYGNPTSSTISGPNTSSVNLDHYHSFSGVTGNENQSHAHTVNINSGYGSADNNNEARPYSATVLFAIRVL